MDFNVIFQCGLSLESNMEAHFRVWRNLLLTSSFYIGIWNYSVKKKTQKKIHVIGIYRVERYNLGQAYA